MAHAPRDCGAGIMCFQGCLGPGRTAHGKVLANGRMVTDLYLFEVKKPSESKKPWDYYKVLATIPGDQAFGTKQESRCALWK